MAADVMAKVDFDPSASEPLGTDIGPYRLVRRLGMGGMAETFVAIRRGPSGFAQRVCLKLVLPHFRKDEEFVKLFQREARLAAKLRHSNIVGVIDFGEIHGRSYMALELVDGVDLQILLEAESGKKLSPEYASLIGHDLASALEHAHNPPRESRLDGEASGAIIHRDISPSNVLISRHGEIMLGDFGVAKAVSSASAKQSAVKGKIPYMSPEQLRLESLDGRADLFGVGVVLYEALSGHRPYEGGHDPATIMLILKGERRPLASLAPSVPAELCAIVDGLIEPDRNNRPASAAELIDLLDPFVPSPRVRRQLGARVGELRPEEPDVDSSGFPPPLGDEATALRDPLEPVEKEKGTSGIVDSRASLDEVEAWSESAPQAPNAQPSPPARRRALFGVAALAAGVVALGAALLIERPATNETAATAPAEERPATVVPTPSVEASTATSSQTEASDPPDEVKRDAAAMAPAEVVDPPAAAKTRRPTSREKSEPGAPAAAVAPARLTVIVYPWGDVWINGKRRGSAPLKNVTLKPGRYKVSAGQGEPRVTQMIRLKAGESRRLKLDVTK